MTVMIERVAGLLGGPAILGVVITSLRELRVRVEEGLPVESLDSVARYVAMNDNQVARIKLGIVPQETLARRRRLTPVESERLARLARIAALAEYVWENLDHARQFLTSEQLSLGGACPIDLAMSDLGACEVEELLMKLEYSLPA